MQSTARNLTNSSLKLQKSATSQDVANQQIQRQLEQTALLLRNANNQPAHYKRVLVRGKSARECSVGNVINNQSVVCMKDHYEMIWVAGGQ